MGCRRRKARRHVADKVSNGVICHLKARPPSLALTSEQMGMVVRLGASSAECPAILFTAGSAVTLGDETLEQDVQRAGE